MQPQMTHFLRDILRQPEELRWTLEHLTGAGAQAIAEAAATLRDAKHAVSGVSRLARGVIC